MTTMDYSCIPHLYQSMFDTMSWYELLEASDVLKMCINGRELIQLDMLPLRIRNLVHMLDQEPHVGKDNLIICLLNYVNDIILTKNEAEVDWPDNLYDILKRYL